MPRLSADREHDMPGSRPRLAAIVLSTVMAASLLTATAAHASDSEADEVVEILESVPSVVPVLQDVDADATALVDPGSTSTADAAVEDVAEVSVSALGASPLDVDLLAADDVTGASVSQDGIEVIDNGDGSSTVPLDRADGSLQVVFVIESRDAPTSYAVDVDLPDGTVLTQDAAGALLATAPDGRLALGVAPAWAYDAAGVAVPTRYVVEGSQISQVVDHASGQYQYPISADPWMGQRLFSPMTVNRGPRYKGKDVYSGRLTPWGAAMGVSPAGLTIMSTAGLAEFRSQWAAVRNSVSLQQQYLCHAIWGRAIIGAGFHWDLEAARPPNANYANVLVHGCNWTTR
jgi:hypothetical protein